jgi:16S rRNA (cytosine967-C5)-methyltransferase
MNASPRRIAVEILNRIDTSGAYAEPLLDAAISGNTFARPADRSLLTELVYGTLRMRGSLDWIIGQIYRKNDTTLETPVRNTLRLGLYQIWFTDRIPPFAVVSEAVKIARDLAPSAAGLINAVLRSSLRKKETIVWPEITEDPEHAIAVLHSHPPWLVRRLLAHHGREEAIEICRANNTIPPLVLRTNTLKASREQVLAAFAKTDIVAESASYSLDGIILTSPVPGLRQTRPYQEGLFRIQDEASQLVAHLCAPEPGERILDLCAGTGGKTLHLAALMKNQGTIIAVDIRAERLRMLREEAKRLGVAVIDVHTGDASVLPKTFLAAYDRVLLDAPCSGLGTLRRNPEIRWRISRTDIKKCMETQKHLLRSAAEYVRPGGRLVYSVCTVTPEENEIIIGDLLKYRSDFRLVCPTDVPPALIAADGFLRTAPHLHGMDGFFACILARVP